MNNRRLCRKSVPFPYHFVACSSAPTPVSRAAYARLSSAGFPPIIDRRGNPPLVIDPKEELPLNLDSEATDNLLCNEIIIQFLALSRSVLTSN